MNLNEGSKLDYCTQLDASGSGRERCAGACFASVLLSAGWDSDPWELTVAVSDEQGWTDQGATAQQLRGAAADANYLFSARNWFKWQEALDALRDGQAVLCLLDNWLLSPRHYPSGASWNALHWLRLYAVVNGGVSCVVYDPLAYPYQGPVVVTTASLRAAIAASPEVEAGVILSRDTG